MTTTEGIRFTSVDKFTKTLHHSTTPSTDPKLVTLPSQFTVCVIGASTGIGEHVAYAYANAKASHIIIASRAKSDLDAVAEQIRTIHSKCKVSTVQCDISQIASVQQLASTIDTLCTDTGLDAVIVGGTASPPFSPTILEDDLLEVQKTYETNVLGVYSAAKFLIPHLLRKPAGAKAFLTLSSQGSTLTAGFAAQPAYSTAKMAQTRLCEILAEQFRDQGLLAASIHPGSVLTRTSAKFCPPEYQYMLDDESGICGALCVWLSRQAGELAWLSGRFLSARWDVDELLGMKEEIVEKDLLKFAMVTS